VGDSVVAGIIEARESKGKFTSFNDFLKKVPVQVCNKRTVESLIKAGAFDSLGHTRRSLMAIFESAVDSQTSRKKEEAKGQLDLFGGLFDEDPTLVEAPELEEFEKKIKLTMERDTLGLYVSDHPLFGRESQLATNATYSIGNFIENENIEDGSTVTLCGLITGIVNRVGKKSGKPYLLVTIEDFEGEIAFLLTGKSFADYVDTLATDQVVAVRGRVNDRDDGRNMNVYSVQILDAPTNDEYLGKIHVRISNEKANREVLERIQYIIKQHPGNSEMMITIDSAEGSRTFTLPQRVRYSTEFIGEMKVLLGMNCIVRDDDSSNEEVSTDSSDSVAALEVDERTLFDS
jgi:DNA polymerase-3 subunit alpha